MINDAALKIKPKFYMNRLYRINIKHNSRIKRKISHVKLELFVIVPYPQRFSHLITIDLFRIGRLGY